MKLPGLAISLLLGCLVFSECPARPGEPAAALPSLESPAPPGTDLLDGPAPNFWDGLQPVQLLGPPIIPPFPRPAPPVVEAFGPAPQLGRFAPAGYAPNMIGDLLGAGKSVAFFINRAEGNTFVNAFGSTNVTNVKIGDDNSPLPRDRVSFKYNHFANAKQVTGISDAPPVFDPSLGVAARTQALQTSEFDADSYTFSLEKTFLDQLLSVEVRVPFSTGLSSHLDLSVGKIANSAPAEVSGPTVNGQRQRFLGFLNRATNKVQAVDAADTATINQLLAQGFERLSAYTVTRTPPQSRGSEATEFGDMTVILKGAFYQSPQVVLSTGLGIAIPTGEDTVVRTTDYLGGKTSIFAEFQRVREFRIQDDTWSLSPFLAALWTPTERFFSQGFWQVELPVNSSAYSFSNTFPNVAGRTPASLAINPIFTSGTIHEQSLMHVDAGTGYWLLRRPEAAWVNGLATTLELHYTTTLEDADLVRLPSDGSQRRIGAGNSAPAPGPIIGNQRNRMDILALTVGSTFEFARSATLATGFAFPLRGGDDRTFDWEFQVQLNFYFGASRGRSRLDQ